ncbi:putative Na+ dependent nucleoside transporter domain-containing protein [Megalodesulfovibrio gigas DSM 1382 = ATCC 19364]|uniref:Putative Na+ dependent nucleoside transporter domain-containing protein n=1 Tax=Megalodesulfovibrio gigas (strain ATCC 19364 / DSM 1382 / NCIMB 9332 / VKM B-1759) TaxID=1121448 RepID=T2GFA7_MEGG1|nr:putative Na+ dependent nucleoside transporter domain-containing protein [Megalodesulfovibrio gigas DSM 1382 = ATCC 19364]
MFILLAWLVSENRRRIPWRIIGAGLAVQLALAGLFLTIPAARQAFLQLNAVVEALETATRAGTTFVFGYLGGGTLPFAEPAPGAAYVFAFRGLPIILVMSALSAALFHLGVLQRVVQLFSLLLRKTLGIGGALGLGTAANIFMGMIEAPLFVRPYLGAMRRNELFALMTAGMATIAGTMLVLYAGILSPVLPDALGHILVASILSAPAAILIAAVMVPADPDAPVTDGVMHAPAEAAGLMDAVCQGTAQGLSLFLHVAASLVVLVALVALVNEGLDLLPDVAGQPLTLQRMFGVLLAPLAWCMGVPWSECHTAGQLLGVKVALNEFIAYMNMAALPADALSAKSRVVLTYAMCGFANFGSLGIMVGGLGSLLPERRAEIAALGLRSILAGMLATCMTGSVAGVFLP